MLIFELLDKQPEQRDRLLSIRRAEDCARKGFVGDIAAKFAATIQQAQENGQRSLAKDLIEIQSEILQSLQRLIGNEFVPPVSEKQQALQAPPVQHPLLDQAWRALNELECYIEQIDDKSVDDVLNAVAATQKIYYRNPGENDHDITQKAIYLRLKRLAAGRKLSALRNGISHTELEETASFLERAMERAYQQLEMRQQRVLTNNIHVKFKFNKATRRKIDIQYAAPQIAEARAFTLGKRLLIVGGIAKETDRRRIEQALECEVTWIKAYKGQNMTGILTAGRNSDILISLIKLSSHAHTDALNTLSRETMIPIVRIPGGFNPASIAHEINEQLLRTH